MANWAKHREDVTGLPVVKRARHAIHFKRSDGLVQAEFTAKPIHFQDALGIWRPIDTDLVEFEDGYYGAGHSDVLIHRNGKIKVRNSDYEQFTKLPGNPFGDVKGDRIIRKFPGGEQHLIMTEDGFKQEIHVNKNKIPVEKFIAKSSGNLPARYHENNVTAEDARGNVYEFTGDVVEFGAWLDKAVYPVVIDPDFAASSNAYYVRGANLDWATARSTFLNNFAGSIRVGVENYDNGYYFVNRSFIKFDTSSIGAGSTVTQVNLKLTPKVDYTDPGYEWDVQIVKQNWSSQDPITSGNAEAAYDGCLAGDADDSIFANTAALTVNTPKTSGNLSTAWVSKTGTTYYSLRGSNDFGNTAPSVHGNPGDDQYFDFCEINHATEAYRPALVVLYSEILPVDLAAADFTLSPVTFDAPVLVNVSSTEDLTAADFTMNAVTFDAPTLEYNWNTPDCRNYVIGAEDRTLVVSAEQREYAIDRDMRGLLITCHNESKYSVGHTYNGLTGKDLTLAQVTFDAPTIIENVVPEPDAAFSFLPFYVIDDGDGTFSTRSKTSPYGAFDLEKYAGITVNKTYYVSMTGNDSNDGLTWDTALRKVSVALGKADVDRIYIGAGTYGLENTGVNPVSTRNLEIIGVGKVYITLGEGSWIGSYSKVGNHYEASYTYPIDGGYMFDLAGVDSNGIVAKYTLKTSAEEVDSTLGSFYYNVTTDIVCVRTLDDRAPDADIVLSPMARFLIGGTGLSVYLENLYIIGGVSGTKLYTKDCIFDSHNFTITGNVYPTIFKNTTVTRTGDDCVRCNGGKVILIDCNLNNAGTGTTINCTSCHDGNMVIVNGDYSYSSGRPIHDIGNGKSWYLGVHAHHGNAGMANFASDAMNSIYFETWCDQCVSSNSGYDFEAGATFGKLHKHNCTGDATDIGPVDTYDY